MSSIALRHRIEHVDDDMARVLAAATEVARLRAGLRMWSTARAVVRAAIAADHADWPSDRIDREVADRMSHGLISRVSQ